MSAVFLDALQAAVFQAVSTTGLTVYDTPPEDAALPYVSLGTTDTTPRPTTSIHTIHEVQSTLHVWTSDADQLSLKEAMGQVSEALETVTLTIEGARFLGLRLLSATTARKFDATSPVQEGRLSFEIRLGTPA